MDERDFREEVLPASLPLSSGYLHGLFIVVCTLSVGDLWVSPYQQRPKSGPSALLLPYPGEAKSIQTVGSSREKCNTKRGIPFKEKMLKGTISSPPLEPVPGTFPHFITHSSLFLVP
jgi:hypothetical protein